MKAKSATFLVLVLIAIAVLSYVDMYGITVGTSRLVSVREAIKPGLDIAGGSIITFEAQADTVSNKEAETVISVIRQRLTTIGYTEANVTRSGDKKFIVEIPSVTNPEEAVKLLGGVAKLRFVDPSGKEVLTGKDVQTAEAKFEKISQNAPAQNFVSITLTDEGVKKFSQATKELAGKPDGQNYIAIMLDDKVYSQPSVKTEITDKNCIIEGGFDAKRAGEFAGVIRSGQLPFSLKEVALSSVGATLGENALKVSINAGAWALLLVILYIIGFYRLPGLVAAISLIGYTGLVALILGMTKINLTLPGIAGIILSIGMAVDANVITFERIIDEMKSGKTLKAAIDAGFKRALTAIVDSNMTTIIAAVVLMFLGTGTVVGFATTLLIGVLTSMFTAIVVTKFLLNQIVGLDIKKRWLYGIGVR